MSRGVGVSMSIPHRVAFVMHGGKEPRGGEWATVSLIKRLDREQFSPIVFYGHDNAAVAQLIRDGVPTYRISSDSSLSQLYLREISLANPAVSFQIVVSLLRSRVIQSLTKLLKTHRVEILYCGDNFSKLVGGIAGRLTKRRVIGCCHDVLDRTLLGHVLRALNLLALDRVIAVSEAVRQSFPLRGPFSRKVITVCNGVDTRMFDPESTSLTIRSELGFDPATIVIGSIGTLDRNKGHESLLRAFYDLVTHCPESLRLVMVGEGPEKGRLQRLTHELGISTLVAFLGYRQDIPAVLKAMDIAVVPTLGFESFSLAAVEAMAMQVPVIASRLGGLAEMIEDGRTGFLYPAGDLASLTGLLRRLAEDAGLRGAMGKAGRARVLERYAVQFQDNRIQKEFLSLCA